MKIIRFLLFPLTLIYHGITAIRNLLFDKGAFKQNSFDLPVIAVGNLSVGGTGKSPQIEYLIRLLSPKYKIATLSRGYKRKTKGFLVVNETHQTEDVGDEPMQFFRKFKSITVAVDADRTNGITQLLSKTEKPEVILLDDAFQHRKVKAGFYVMLTRYNDLFVDDFVLPTGNLREGRNGAKRADVIVVTKCPEFLSEEERECIKRKIPLTERQTLFFSSIRYSDYLIGENKNLPVNSLGNKEVVVVTGIAAPKPFIEFIKGKGIRVKHIAFPDHHHFSMNDIKTIQNELDLISSNDKMIITTEKDYVRLEGKIDNLFYLSIESVFLKGKSQFDAKILQYVERELK